MTTADLTAKILRTDDEVIVIRFAGKWESKHFRDGDPKFPITASATGIGIGVFDRKKKELQAVLFVLGGSYKNGTVATPTAAVVEWQVEKPKEE